MAENVVVSRELKSLQDELSAAQRERMAAPAAAPGIAEPAEESAEERELRDQLRDLANEVTGFFAEGEKGIAAHPSYWLQDLTTNRGPFPPIKRARSLIVVRADWDTEHHSRAEHLPRPTAPCAWRRRSCRAPARRSPRARTGRTRAAR